MEAGEFEEGSEPLLNQRRTNIRRLPESCDLISRSFSNPRFQMAVKLTFNVTFAMIRNSFISASFSLPFNSSIRMHCT